MRTRIAIGVGALAAVLGCASAPAAPAANTCGIHVFASPACESSLDYMCCSQKVDCANDASCSQLAQCLMTCKHVPGDACPLGCMKQQQPSPAVQHGITLWQTVIACASKANVPNCGDDS